MKILLRMTMKVILNIDILFSSRNKFSSKIWATKTQQETVTSKAQSTAQDRWKLTGVPRHQFVWRSVRKPQK